MAKPPAFLRFSVWRPQGLWRCDHPRSPAPRPWVTPGLPTAISSGPACSSLVGRFRVVKGAGTTAGARGARHPGRLGAGGGGGGLGIRTRPSRARFGARSQAPPRTWPSRPAFLSSFPLCAAERPGALVVGRGSGPAPSNPARRGRCPARGSTQSASASAPELSAAGKPRSAGWVSAPVGR